MRGRVFARSPDGRFYYKAINTDTVPHLPTSFCTIDVASDGRFGTADPLHLPQLFSCDHPHWALTPRRPSPDHPAFILWRLPTRCDVDDLPNTTAAEGLVLVKSATRELLHAAVAWLKPAYRKRVASIDSDIHGLEKYLRDQGPGANPRFQNRLTGQREDKKRLVKFDAELVYALSIFGAPSSFRDFVLQWAHLHRCWVQCWAFVELCGLSEPTNGIPKPLHSGLDGAGVMGAFTPNRQNAVRLCGMGIPVWEIGHIQHAEQGWAWQAFQAQDNLPQGRADVPEGWRQDVPAGDKQFNAIAVLSRRLADRPVVVWQPEQRLPPQLRYTSQTFAQPVASTSTTARQLASTSTDNGAINGKISGESFILNDFANTVSAALKSADTPAVNQFAEKIHVLLPQRVPVWQAALEAIDTSNQPANGSQPLGSRLPDPEFLFTPQTPGRVFFYCGTWVAHRLRLVHMVISSDPTHVPLRTSVWRVLFDRQPSTGAQQPDAHATPSQPSKKGQQKVKALKTLSQVLGVDLPHRAEPIASFMWRGHTLQRADFAESTYHEASVRPLREMAWELGEMRFRTDLQELDRHLMPNVAADALVVEQRNLLSEIAQGGHPVMPSLPPRRDAGLWAARITDRAASLEGIRKLLLRWPDSPSWLTQAPVLSAETSSDVLLEFEKKAARYYCQRFFDCFGRAPAVPRIL